MSASKWYFVAATYDAHSGEITLYQEPVVPWSLGNIAVVAKNSTRAEVAGSSEVPLLMAAYWLKKEGKQKVMGGHFNGKVDSPRFFSRALNSDEGQSLKTRVAAWDFSKDIASKKVTDVSPNGLHADTVNMPTRAVTGHNWTQNETNFVHAPNEYGAIYFHNDDLE